MTNCTDNNLSIIWKPITDYEGLYLISDNGEIRSLERFDRYGRYWPGAMKPLVNSSGYVVVSLCKGGISKRCLIHRLIVSEFISSPEPGKVIKHINGNKTDNLFSNLEWCTYSENNKHAHAVGLNYISQSSRASTSKRMKLRRLETRNRWHNG